MKKLVFATAAALSFAVMAQEGPHRLPPRLVGGGDMMGEAAVMAVMNPKVAEKVGLSEEVRNQIKQFDNDNKAKIKELQAKTRTAMENQAKLMKAEKIDEAAVMSAIDELFDARKGMAKAQTQRIIKIKSMLTPEQIAKASEVMKAMREERHSRRLEGGERGPKPPRGPKPECKTCPKPGCDKPECDKPECDKPVPPPEA